MAVISDALPIQFWPISGQTFNEQQVAFVDLRPFYQEFLDSDTIKLQVSNETSSSNYYALRIVDCDGNQIKSLDFTRSLIGANYCFDLEFTWQSLSLPSDQYVRFYISLQEGTLDPSTLDGTTLDTFTVIADVWKSDYVLFSSQIPLHAGYGTRVINYNSTKNFVGIKYPNNGHYFQIRIPSRFYKPRNVRQQNSLPLSNSSIVTTSIVITQQKLLETVLLPQYMLNKLELILQHCVAGSVVIDGIEWQADESFDRKDTDPRCAFDMASTWLSKGLVRNII